MILFWIVDSVIDATFEHNSIAEQLFAPDTHEIANRLLAITVQILFIIYISRILARRRKLEEELAAAKARVELEKARSEAILEEMGDAISIQDTGLRILYQNRAHREMMGSHPGEYCYAAYQQRESVCPGCHLELSFKDGKSHFRQVTAQTGKGIVHAEIISTPLRDADGAIIAGIEAVRDVTERKEAEEEIRRLNEELTEHAQELAASNRELEAFSYSLSHDLRTPLTKIYAAAQILEEGYAARLGDDGRLLLRTLCEASEGMEELIEAMLTLFRVTRTEMIREVVDLTLLAREIAGELQMSERGREVEFVIAPDITVEGDVHLLKVALENLLANAWKYTGLVAHPRVEFGVTYVEGEKVYFVRDNGAGFDMRDADKLFKPFKRLHDANRFPGTGIGLATVQRIIGRHGGRVWGEGVPDHGATFSFTLK